MSESIEALYICKQYPKFSFRLINRRIQFQNGELRLIDKAEISMLDNLLKTNPSFTQKIQKVDKAGAEAFVREQIRKNQAGAIKGGITSEAIKHAQTPLEERDEAFAGMTPQQSQNISRQMAEDSDLILSEKVEKPAVDSVDKSESIKPLSSLLETK